MSAARSDLCFELHFGEDLVMGDVLRTLQEVLARVSPKLSATLEILAYERDRGRLRVDHGDPDSLRQAVLARGTERGELFGELADTYGGPPTGRRFGHVLARGRGPDTGGLFLSIHFDSLVPARPSDSDWLWSNSVSGRVRAARVDRVNRDDWVLRLVDEFAARATILWGAAYLHPEFAHSNLDTTGGVCAIGRDMRTALPGMYWLNIFGPPYVDLIGEPRLLSVPADDVRRVGEHVVVRVYEDPESWTTRGESRHAAMGALGDDYFFDRSDPARRHRAPDFGLPELPERKPFQVLTTDGINFTPLPELD